MKITAILAALFGLLGTIWLFFHFGFHAIWIAATSVGAPGFLALVVYGAANIVLLGLAWSALESPYDLRNITTFVWGRAVRDSAGELLPFSQLGGLVIGARATILRGVRQPVAFATTIVDMTLEMIAQIFFILTGLFILAVDFPVSVFRAPMVRTTFVGMIIATLIAASFFLLQRRGFAFLEEMSARFLSHAKSSVGAVRQALDRIHNAPRRMFAGFLIHVAGWLSSAFGTWLTLYLIGAPISLAAAITIEAILCAIRSAAIFVPAAIGVQEAAYMALMPLFGLPPQIGIAVSLLKRAREFTLGVPVLLGWQVAEGRSAISLGPRHPLTENER